MNKGVSVVFKDCDKTENDFTSTRFAYKQNAFIRDYLAGILEGTSSTYKNFDWNYWITITMGNNPSLSEAEDILYKANYSIDNRMLKHSGKSVMTTDERSEWILFPEKNSSNGLHYHGFIKLNVKPNLGRSYENEWLWMFAAFKNTFKSLNKFLTNQGRIGFRIYERGFRTEDRLKMIFYSMKELGYSTDKFDLDPKFDRFSNTIISALDWKPSQLNRSRAVTKTENIPPRQNKIGALGF